MAPVTAALTVPEALAIARQAPADLTVPLRLMDALAVLAGEVDRMYAGRPRPDAVVVPLPWELPPLSLNDRRHWRAHHKERAAAHEAARWAVRAARLGGPHTLIEACLHYRPTARGRRDQDNLVATAKVVFDTLAGGPHGENVVPDDTPQYMRKLMPRIEPAVKGLPGSLWLTVSVLA